MPKCRTQLVILFSDEIQKTLLMIGRHGGRIAGFVPDGRSGGNPELVIEFDSFDQAVALLKEYNPQDSDDFLRSRIEVDATLSGEDLDLLNSLLSMHWEVGEEDHHKLAGQLRNRLLPYLTPLPLDG